MRRVEDPRLLRGEGRFLADLARPGVLHAAFLRSPLAHARIARIDLTGAAALPGVHFVLDGPAAARLARPFQVPLRTERYRPAAFPHLALDKVRFAGEPVVMVVADDAYLARDALELIEVEYEPLPVVTDPLAALGPDAPLVHEHALTNALFEHEHAIGDVDGAFASAAVVVEATFRLARQSATPLEPRGALAELDPDGRLRVWSSTQAPFSVRDALASALDLPPSEIVVGVPDVGGGFGAKAQVYAEEMLVAAAARQLGRPVAWVGDRLEDLQATCQARDQIVRAALAADADGVVTALEAEVTCDVGAYGCYPYGPALEALGTPAMLPGVYAIERYRFRSRAVATNKAPQGAYRGVGMVAAAFVHERLMDLLAARLGLDPAEVRRRNFIPSESLPRRSAGNLLYDSGSFRESLDLALETAAYPALRQVQEVARQAGRLVGIGIGCYVEYTGLGSEVYRNRGMDLVDGREGAALTVEADGTVRAVVSMPSIGQGLATTFGQVVADQLGLPLERVRVLAPDTDQAPLGTGTFASRGAVLGGGALAWACEDLQRQAVELAAGLVEANPDDLQFEQGGVAPRGVPERRIELAELAAAAERAGGCLATWRVFDPPGVTFANATHLAVVEVDPETGLARVLRYLVAEDCGRVINPLILDGQVHGAVAQGLGAALLEEVRYDEAGQLLTGSMLDYLLPGADELPNVEIRHLATPAPNSPLGVKGVGEGGTVGAVPAVANAIADAIGRPVSCLPVTPSRILAALRGDPPPRRQPRA